jgi:hypothetical protein
MRDISPTYQQYKDRGFEILGINLDEPATKDKALKAIKENNATWRHIYTGKGFADESVNTYGVSGIPLQILIDKDGKILAIDHFLGEKLTAALKALPEKGAASQGGSGGGRE